MRQVVDVDGVGVRRYGEPRAELEALIPSWLRSGSVNEGHAIRPGRVWRWNDLAVKLFPARSALAQQLRPSRAIRCAELHFEIRPLPSPRPVLATNDRDGSSLLVYEFVEGRHLRELWDGERAAIERFPEFLATMHELGVYHGDFHIDQVIWDGTGWHLLDLEGIRHRLRNLLPQRLVEGHWSRVYFGLAFHCAAEPDELRELYDRYASIRGRSGDAQSSWRRIERRARAHWENWRRWNEERGA